MADLDAVEVCRIVDEQCDLFEAAWRGHGEPAIGECLAAVPEPFRGEVFGRLLAIELELIARSGKWPAAEVYREEYPQYAECIESAFAELQEWAAKTDAVGDEVKSVVTPIERDTAQHSVAETVVWNDGSTHKSPPATAPVPGLPTQIGRYRIVKELGKGGMGTVLLAKDTVLDRDLALKLPKFEPADGDEPIERFYREARAMATVHHPHLCQIYDAGEADGYHYLTMAYIDGQTLDERISDQPLSQDEAVRLVRTLALAIHAAHEAGVVHRDLKPSNVMINGNGEPFITDFGLALRDAVSESDITHSGAIVGSPAYMAPEQVEADNDRIGPHTDVYALGVMLYQLLTGRRPFEGKGLAVLGQISSGVAPPPPSQFADVAPSVESICLNAMAHRIDDRYPSAIALADELQSCGAESGKDSHFPGTQVRTAVAVLCGLGLIAALGVFWRTRERSESPNVAAPLAIATSNTDSVGTQPLPEFVREFVSAEWAEPERFAGPVNGPMIDGSPAFSSDGLSVMFHRPNARLGTYKLWISKRASLQSTFDVPRLMPAALNEAGSSGSRHRFNPRLSHDERSLVFNCGMENGKAGVDLWYSQRESVDAAWEEARPFEGLVNSSRNDMSPFLTDDRLTLFFASERRGGAGGFDLWTSTRSSVDEPFSEPVNLGTRLNTQADETHPWLSADGCLLLFHSARPEGLGGSDLWYSTRPSRSDEFGPAVNFGAPVNSPNNESFGSLSPDGDTLYFESTRPGGAGRVDIWMARRNQGSSAAIRNVDTPADPTTNPLMDSGQQLGDSFAFGVAAGDIDGDGDKDIVVANGGDDQPSQIWLNDGHGNFSQGQQLECPGGSDVELADLDMDEDDDIVIACRKGPSVIWLNDGEGRFEKLGELEDRSAKQVEVGDLDGDGTPDVLIGGLTSENRVLFNDGTAHFTDSGQKLTSPSQSLGMALADLDGDSDRDAFVSNWGGGNQVWINDGSGHFTDSGQQLSGLGALHVALGDLDNDGDTDAVVACETGSTYAWINDGSAEFEPVSLSEVKAPALSVAIADITGDGRNDILLGNGQIGSGYPMFPNQLLISTGHLTWESHWFGAEATAGFGIDDLDGDGDLDAFLANGFDHPNHVWMNRLPEEQSSPVYFRDSGQRLGWSTSNGAKSGDVDSDGDLDVVVANSTGDSSIVWINDGSGQFAEGMRLPEPLYAYDAEFGDLDDDGDLDVFLTDKSGPNRVWLNDGDGNFSVTDQQIGDSSSNQVALADFDGDGDLDAWVGNFNPHHDRLWLNDGTGRFEDSGQELGAGRNYSVTTADVENDGDIDVLIGTGSSHANILWLNDGQGRFTRSDQDLNGVLASNGFMVGDLNGDGFVDLYECSWQRSDAVWLNDGTGHFAITQTGQKLRSRRAGLADFDEDGDLDVFVTNEVNLPNAVCLNDGQGTLSLPVQFVGNSPTADVALADFDGDGDIDAFTANAGSTPNRVWLNESSAERHVSQSVPDYPSGSAANIFTSNDYKWTVPAPLDLGGADQAFIAPFISTDGLDLYMVHVAPDRSLDIVVSTRETRDDSWQFPIPLSGPVNASSKNGSPTVSSDGKVIIFGSNRPGGQGSYDLWMAQRESKNDEFGDPVNLGPTINSEGDDGAARLSPDGLSFIFHSTRPDGHGGHDLWKCTRKTVDEPFGPPENLGPEVNTDQDERDPATSEDGTVLIYRYANRNLQMRTRHSISDPYGRPAPLPCIVDE